VTGSGGGKAGSGIGRSDSRSGSRSGSRTSSSRNGRFRGGMDLGIDGLADGLGSDDDEIPPPGANTANQPSAANSLVYDGDASALHFRVNCSSRPEVYNIVTDVLRCWPYTPSNPAPTSVSASNSGSRGGSRSGSRSGSRAGGTSDRVAALSEALGASTAVRKSEPACGAGHGNGEGGFGGEAKGCEEVVPSGRWVEMPTGLGLGTTWNLLWTWSKPRINYETLLVWQRVNHYPKSRELTRKDLLKRNIGRYEALCAGSKSHAGAFDIMPRTFVLPHEYSKFIEAFYAEDRAMAKQKASTQAELASAQEAVDQAAEALARAKRAYDPKAVEAAEADVASASNRMSSAAAAAKLAMCPNYWILKPVGLSRGRGISMISDVGCVKYDTSTVVQQYLRQPLLLEGFKFDLRLYVLVTSFDPLEAWLYKEGFVRLSTRRYDTSIEKQDDLFVHLTNSSINKFNTDGQETVVSPGGTRRATGGLEGGGVEDEDGENALGGTKRSLGWLWRKLKSTGILSDDDDGRRCTVRGQATTTATGTAAATATATSQAEERRPSQAMLWQRISELVLKSLLCVEDEIPPQRNSFEVYGYDVLIDADLRPWLIEVNASPAMARDTPLDCRVKEAMIRDTIAVVDPVSFDRDALVNVLGRRRTGPLTSTGIPSAPPVETVDSAGGDGPPGEGESARASVPAATTPMAPVDAAYEEILHGHVPRRVGESPRFVGNYERLAPGTTVAQKCQKIKASICRTKHGAGRRVGGRAGPT